MKILYIGFAVERGETKDNPAVSVAGNNFELGLLKALQKREDLSVFTVPPQVAWPTGKMLKVSFSSRIIENRLKVQFIRYLNIKFLKELSIMISLKKEISIFCRDNGDDEIVVISYNGDGEVSVPVLRLAKKYNYTYACIAVDPPLYQGTTTRKSIIWQLIYKIKHRLYMNAATKCDKIVVLNKYFADTVLKRNDYHVMDCGVDLDYFSQINKERMNDVFWEKDHRIHLVFIGSIHEHSGILRFIKMFRNIRPQNVTLHVFGTGIYENELKRIIEDEEMICFHGKVSNEVAYEIEVQADYLVCPNIINHPINKVAFPSKILEYMLSGTPVIATEVNGLTEDYFPYCFHYNDSMEGLKQVFEEILASPDKGKKMAIDAREFVAREKNWDIQVERLVKYLKKDET